MLELHPTCWYSVGDGTEASARREYVLNWELSVMEQQADRPQLGNGQAASAGRESYEILLIVKVYASVMGFEVRPGEFRFPLLELIAGLGILLTIRF